MPAPFIPEINKSVDQENQADTINEKKNIYGHWMFSDRQPGSP